MKTLHSLMFAAEKWRENKGIKKAFENFPKLLKDYQLKNKILIEIEAYIKTVEQNDIKYYKRLRREGILFIEFNKCNQQLVDLCKEGECFGNSKYISKITKFDYYEGLACINGNILEHAINHYKGLAFDHTAKKFSLDVKWFFGAKDLRRNNPLLTFFNLFSLHRK